MRYTKLLILILILSFPNKSNSQNYVTQKISSDVLIEDSRIGLVQGISVYDEMVYVGDIMNYKVHVYENSGDYIVSIGRQGRGPGEFRTISGTRVGPDDSLYVYDFREQRVTVVSTNSSKSNLRTMRLSSGSDRLTPNVTGNLVSGIEGLWITKEGGILVSYRRPIDPRKKLKESNPLEIRYANNTSEDSPVLRTRDRQILILDKGERVSMTNMPFGMKPVIDMHRRSNSIYFGLTDSLVIRRKPLNGKVKTVLSHEFSRVELSDDLLRARLKWKGDENLLKRFETVQEKSPSYVPAFEDFVVDKQGRIWVAVNTRRALEGGHTEYWIFDADGRLLRKISFERLVFVKAFGDKYAYGLATKPNGVQQIVHTSLDSLLP